MEKVEDLSRTESVKESSSLEDESIGLPQLSAAQERKIVTKLDCCIAPVMAMFYLLSFLVGLV